MKKNDKNIEKLTSGLVKNLGVEEPSSDFTQRVMQVVLLEQKYSSKKNYWWLFITIPVFFAVGWYIVELYDLQIFIHMYLSNITNLFKDTLNTVLSSFNGIRLHPTYYISFIAILLLLTIEETLRRREIGS